MNRHSLLLILAFLCTLSYSQVNKKKVEEINQKVAQIRKEMPSLRQSEKYRDSSGTRVAYLKGNELKVTRAAVKDQLLNRSVEWFFENGQIIYCEQLWTQRSNGATFNNEKLYVNNGKLFYWLTTNGTPHDTISNEWKETSFRLIDYSKTLLKEAAKP